MKRLLNRLSVSAVLAAVALITFLPQRASAAAKINVVTATTDLASIAAEVGGDRIHVESIARGYQDPHFVEAKPSFLLKLRRADLLIAVGRDLEIGWLPPLISQSGNPKIQGPGANGYLDASQFAEILEVPTGPVSRAMGDVHPLGNPHYWLDPENGRRLARGIANKFSEMRPSDAGYFQQQLASFEQRLTQAEKTWDAEMAPYHGRKVVGYHNSWPNFAKHFGIDVVGFVEPRPGIPPTPSHTLQLIQQMKANGVKIVMVEPYFDLKTPNSIAAATGGKVVVMFPSVGGVPDITDYFKVFDKDIALLTAAFKSTQ